MNERLVRMFLAASTALAMFGIPSLSHAATPDVILSEVAWAGSSASSIDEWLELTNLTDATIDVGGWTVVGAAVSGGTLTIPAGSVIQPYSTFLISNYADDNDASALGVRPEYVSPSVSLSNAALSLVLADAGGVAHDAAGNGSAPLAGSAGGNGGGYASMARRSPVNDGALADAWVAASASSGFDVTAAGGISPDGGTGVTDFGTPGSIEPWFVPATAETTEILTTIETGEPPTSVETPAEIVENPVFAAEPEPIALPETVTEEPVVPVESQTTVSEAPPETTVETTDAAIADLAAPDAPTAATESVEITAVPIDAADAPAEEEPAAAIETVEVVGATDDSAPTTDLTTPDEPTAVAPPLLTLRINEFASDATDEWIEIMNENDGSISLSGWSVEDATGKATLLPEQTLDAGQFLVIANPKGILNNDGDAITLLDPTGAVVDEIAYGTDAIPAPQKDESTARDADGAWKRTTAETPGAANEFTTDIAASEDMAVEETAVTASTASIVATEVDTPETVVTEEVETVTETTTAAVETVTTVTAVQTETAVETSAEETAPWSGPTTLRLSELYANTSGDDAAEEFIEIENTGDANVDLRGWQVADASGKTFTAKESTVIAPHSLLALRRDTTKLTLNNDADAVTLTAPNGTVVDTRPYDHAKKGSSFVLVSSEWVWSGTPTPNEPNVVPADAPAAVATASGSGVTQNAATARASVEGVVLVPPGVLGSQTFYVSTDDGGTQVYKYDGDFPALAEGDVVRVTGTTTTARGEERLKISKTDSIRVVGSGEPVAAKDRTIAELSAADGGTLVRVFGTVVMRAGDKATVEDGPDQLTVRVADGTGIDIATFVRGKKFHVTGILTAAGGKLTLLPRSPDDIEPVEDPAAAAAASIAPTGTQSAASRDAATAAMITAGVGLALAAYSARQFGPKLLQRYAKARALRAAA